MFLQFKFVKKKKKKKKREREREREKKSCCRNKANCPHVEPGPMGDMPSMGVFLRNHSPYLLEFQ